MERDNDVDKTNGREVTDLSQSFPRGWGRKPYQVPASATAGNAAKRRIDLIDDKEHLMGIRNRDHNREDKEGNRGDHNVTRQESQRPHRVSLGNKFKDRAKVCNIVSQVKSR